MTTPDTTTPAPGSTPGAARGPGPGAGSPAGRLPAGELRRQVAAYLADHPGQAFTPGQVAAALGGRSSGAVGNALGGLTGLGQARLVTPAPRRYQATPTTPAAAATVAIRSAVTAPSAPAVAGGPPVAAGASGRRRVAPVPEPSAGGGSVEEVNGPVVRPNGTPYQPRTLSGMADVTALRKLREAGVPALLYGPPGTGKTSVVEAAFPDLATVAGDGDTTVADLVGEYTQTPGGRYVFVHGPLVRAMREGRALFLDDATLIPPSVLAVVYPAMDGRREIIVKANGGEVITAAQGFYVCGGHNPNVHGAVLTDALSSRFAVHIQVSTDFDLARQLGIDSRATRVARNLALRQYRGDIGWSPQLRELIAFQKIAAVLGVNAAAANLIGIAPEADRETVADVVVKAFGASLTSLTPLALGAQITPTHPTSFATPGRGTHPHGLTNPSHTGRTPGPPHR